MILNQSSSKFMGTTLFIIKLDSWIQTWSGRFPGYVTSTTIRWSLGRYHLNNRGYDKHQTRRTRLVEKPTLSTRSCFERALKQKTANLLKKQNSQHTHWKCIQTRRAANRRRKKNIFKYHRKARQSYQSNQMQQETTLERACQISTVR